MNKIFFYLFFFCCTTLFLSCEKEISLEKGTTLKAEGSLLDTAGNCFPDSVRGTFYNGITPGSDTAYVEIKVNVTSTGSYKIESEIEDGFLFSDSGFFSNTGINTIRLKPIGTPIIQGSINFNINFDSTFCDFTVTVQDSTGTGLGGQDTTGTGSLKDSLGNCLPIIVNGTYYNGVAPGDTNFVTIQVDVAATGDYSIFTNLSNGFSFAGSGTFTDTGINTIQLAAIGTPIIPGTTNFDVTFNNTTCSFIVNVQDSTGTGLGGNQGQSGTWQFTASSFIYQGNIDDATKDNSSGVTFIHVGGATSTGDTTLSLDFLIPAADIQTGTYTTLSNGIIFSVVDGTNLTVLYSADGFTAGTDITITVTSYDAATKEMKGTFTGNAQNSAGSIVPVTNGSFDVFFP